MSPSAPQILDHESSHHQEQSIKSRKFDPLVTSIRKLFRGKKHSKLVTPQDSSTDNSRLYGEIEHPDLVSHSLPSNSRAIEQGVGATLQDAHHFTIGGNARIVNIGQQNVNNRRGYGLDTLEKFVSFSALHDSSAQDPERCCHPGTRESVLNQMRNWADDPSTPERILWLHGPAGVGKSAIAQTVSCSYDRDKIGATFFFFRSDANRKDGNKLFPTLAWQLALSIPTIKNSITSSLEDYPDLPRKAIEVQFERLIAQPFLTIPDGECTSPTCIRVVIIDGLDECSDVKLQQRILKLIGNAVSDPRFPLRFIISSRPEAHIGDFFAQFQYPTLQIDLANVDGAYYDIKYYFTSEFLRIALEQELDPEMWPGQRTIDTLVSKSSAQFIYARTVIECVGAEYESAVEQLDIILGLKPSTGRSPFSELDTLYAEILQRQPDKHFLKEFLPLLVARSMLAHVEDRYLHEDDAMLLGLENKQLHRKLRGMHSLLKFKPFIDVHHKSFLDFLDDPSRSGEYHINEDFANRRYMKLITNALVKAASSAMAQPDSHKNDHFQPRFASVIKEYLLSVQLPLDELEEILRPLLVIQENLLQLPDMSVPWKPRACEECWTFYMIDDLLLHLTLSRRAAQPQESKFVGLRPLTTTEERQIIPQIDLDACLSLLLANLKGVEVSLDVRTIGLVRALVRFAPTNIAMKIRSIMDAENLVELILCLSRGKCFKSWFGVAAHNATRLALALYGRVPLLPRSLFLGPIEPNFGDCTNQGKTFTKSDDVSSIRRLCFNLFMWLNLSHANTSPLLGICPDLDGILSERQLCTDSSASEIQRVVLEVAKVLQYAHSLGIVFCSNLSLFLHGCVYLDYDPPVEFPSTHLNGLCKGEINYRDYETFSTLEDNIKIFGDFLDNVFWDQFLEMPPQEPEILYNVRKLIQCCRTEDPKERPTMDQIVEEMESWVFLGQFTLSP